MIRFDHSVVQSCLRSGVKRSQALRLHPIIPTIQQLCYQEYLSGDAFSLKIHGCVGTICKEVALNSQILQKSHQQLKRWKVLSMARNWAFISCFQKRARPTGYHEPGVYSACSILPSSKYAGDRSWDQRGTMNTK
jgi:hypothetical protein